MFRVGIVAAVVLSLLTSISLVSAQEIDASFSDEVIQTLGLPEIEVRVSPDGVDAPESVSAGYQLITLNAAEPHIGYLNIVQFPAELDEATAIEQMLAAGANDMPQEGWTYFGGTNIGDVGEPSTFAINLEPGDYHWAVSYYGAEEDSEEIMSLVPFTVTEVTGDASPVEGELAATVTLEETDNLEYTVSPAPVPAGPQVWKISNTGTHLAHHMVMFRIPEDASERDIIGEFNAMFAGTPVAGEPVMAQAAWVGYAALQSGGQTIWTEFDLEPATYVVICFILNPETGRPHILDGMVTTFTVE